MTFPGAGKLSGRRGSTLTEFTIVALELFIVMFAVIEFGRMALVYNNVAHAARVGQRYAIVHGGDRTGSGIDGSSGPTSVCGLIAGVSNDTGGTNVFNTVIAYARSGALDTNKLAFGASSGGRVQVAWPDGDNCPGSRVQVTVVYPYDPFFVLPISVPLGTTSEGIITF